jgi:hypothetical protein
MASEKASRGNVRRKDKEPECWRSIMFSLFNTAVVHPVHYSQKFCLKDVPYFLCPPLLLAPNIPSLRYITSAAHLFLPMNE